MARPDPPRESRGVHETTVSLGGRPARAFVGGEGPGLLLVHGGWGGAALHWSRVWHPLAQHFRVVAPELPGFGRTEQPGLGSIGAYAQWLRRVLDAHGVESAWCVGNSFGASLACQVASDFPEDCLGLVLVNGIPLPPTPPLLRRLGERRLGTRVMRAIERRVAFTPSALARGFFDPGCAPEELRAVLRDRHPEQVDALADVLVQGGSARPDRFAPLLLWGEDDRLPGTSARHARRLEASWPGARLAFVRRAGHCPQIERPDAFVETLLAFIGPSARAR